MTWTIRLIITSLIVWSFFAASQYKHHNKRGKAPESTQLTECLVNGKVFKIIDQY